MKTKETIQKYKAIIAGLLQADHKDIHIQVEVEIEPYGNKRKEFKDIGEIVYIKPETDPHVYDSVNFSQGNYRVLYKDTVVSTWKLYELPHCCAYLISCNVKVELQFRNKRVGTVLNMLRQDIGRLLGYATLLCTDVDTNTHQRQLLKTNGWTDIHSVRNKRTKNLVHLSYINL